MIFLFCCTWQSYKGSFIEKKGVLIEKKMKVCQKSASLNQKSTNMKISRKGLLGLCLILTTFLAHSQSYKITGTVLDINGESLVGASAYIIEEGKVLKGASSDKDGRFTISEVKKSGYILAVTYIGYKDYSRNISIENQDIDLGKIRLEEDATQLGDVLVETLQARTVQKGDTLQYNANAFKVMEGSNADKLIEKMPGIVINNGKVQAQGEDVKRILVDNKPFFGDDPMATLSNLPSDIIDKIEVFDKMSDQAEFTGVDDGNSYKTINIVTAKDKRNGQFGKLYGGYGTDGLYVAGGNLNLFKGDSRLSIIGLSNNVNSQNFSMEDIVGATGSTGGGRGGRGGGRRGGQGGSSPQNFMVGQQPGVSKVNSFGLNYTNNFSDKLDLSASYFFNKTNNVLEQESLRQTFLNKDSISYYDELSWVKTENYNHRFNMKLDYKINAKNSITFRPNLSFQANNNLNLSEGSSFFDKTAPLSTFKNQTNREMSGYNIGGDLTYRHRFDKKGRTLSLGLNTTFSNKDSESIQDNHSESFMPPSVADIRQRNDAVGQGFKISSSLVYTEPVGEFSILNFNYKNSFSEDQNDKEVSDYDFIAEAYTNIDSLLSNKYENDYMTHSGGVGYRYRNKGWMISGGLSYQHSTLMGNQLFPFESELDKSFNNVLPNLMLSAKINSSNSVRLRYRANTNAPSISRLQSVIDNSNPLMLSSGNPLLDESYSHNLSVRYTYTNTEKGLTLMYILSGVLTQNYIGNSRIVADESPVTLPNGYVVPVGGQYTQPVNLDGYKNFRTMLVFGMPIDWIKSNLNLTTSFNYNQQPSLINSLKNRADNYTTSLGLVIGSNISDKLDFTVSYNGSYNTLKNNLQTSGDNNYLNHQAKLRFEWDAWNGIVLRTDGLYSHYKGLTDDFDEKYFTSNASLSKRLWKNKLECSLGVYDIFNNQDNFSRNITDSYIEDTSSNLLGRYYMASMRFNIRNFKL